MNILLLHKYIITSNQYLIFVEKWWGNKSSDEKHIFKMIFNICVILGNVMRGLCEDRVDSYG